MNSELSVSTQFISPDEKAYWLTETWRRTALGDRRHQEIAVLRGDTIAIYQDDLGAWDINADKPLQIPGFWEYSVGELREMADMVRGDKPPDRNEPIDLITVWAKELDERRMRRDHTSVSGLYLTKER